MKFHFLRPGARSGSSRADTGARSQRLDFALQAATPVLAAAVFATVLKPKASHALVSEIEADPVALPSALSNWLSTIHYTSSTPISSVM
jgi:hypothetical protein